MRSCFNLKPGLYETVIPASAGIQLPPKESQIPASAGMTAYDWFANLNR